MIANCKLISGLLLSLALVGCGPLDAAEQDQDLGYTWKPAALVDGGTYSKVSFTSAQATTVLDMVNSATLTQLDVEIALTSTAAKNIVAARPIKTLAALDAVSYVGAAALKALKAYVPRWKPSGPTPPTGGGTYDSVTFTASEEQTALKISNQATDAQLKAGKVTTAARKVIIAGRPRASLKVLAAAKGIGPATLKALRAMVSSWSGATTAPPQLTVKALVAEAAANGTKSKYYDKLVSVPRAIISTNPSRSSNGTLICWIADPTAGSVKQLKVYVAASAKLKTSFASVHDDISLSGKFTRYGSTWELALEQTTHSLALNKNGLAYKYYKSVQAAWRSTAKNPEGVVRVTSSSGYVYMVPLPLFQHHPMWSSSPGAPKDSGNEQDLAWNAAAQQALNAWLKAQGK